MRPLYTHSPVIMSDRARGMAFPEFSDWSPSLSNTSRMRGRLFRLWLQKCRGYEMNVYMYICTYIHVYMYIYICFCFQLCAYNRILLINILILNLVLLLRNLTCMRRWRSTFVFVNQKQTDWFFPLFLGKCISCYTFYMT